MGLVDKAAATTDNADLIILANVETIRDQAQPATPSAVASLIGGAPVDEIAKRMLLLAKLGVLEMEEGPPKTYQLSEMGAELLRRELVGWSPSNREERRREASLLSRAFFRT
jgi:hypothetical protein